MVHFAADMVSVEFSQSQHYCQYQQLQHHSLSPDTIYQQESDCTSGHILNLSLKQLYCFSSRQYLGQNSKEEINTNLIFNMDAFSSQGDISSPNTLQSGLSRTEGSDQNVSASRARRKLGRAGSKPWFNKSFDQTVLQQATKPSPSRPMRRQNSVTDFFQNMLSKSKSHLQDIFTTKKEKSRQLKSARSPPPAMQSPSHLSRESSGLEGAAGGDEAQPDLRLTREMKASALHNSCPSFCESIDESPQIDAMDSQVSLRPDPHAAREKRANYEKSRRITSPTNLSATMNMFIVTKPDNFRSKSEDAGVSNLNQHRPIVKKSSLPFSSPSFDSASLAPSIPSPSHQQRFSPSRSPGRLRGPKIVTLSSHDSSDSADEGPYGRRNVSSAPPGRQSVCSASSLLATDDHISRTKRALVKSNSDTFARLNSSPQPLVKASSDGNCFKKSPTSSLASSMTSLGNVMISVTDYLFLGSIEAAYNEPLLCKYGISSLIDMTNINPTLVPANKKSDCPCSCVSKTHFRSKLNIGVDDIEWENLEQYFEEINAFVHGARKKGRRVLVFSYMGQSRAAAAVIQHLMQHFKMPYREALNIVRAKRPQIKLNSGFVKALRRLEKHLGLEEVEKDVSNERKVKPEESPMVSRGSVEMINHLSAPPVVRGAWLEC